MSPFYSLIIRLEYITKCLLRIGCKNWRERLHRLKCSYGCSYNSFSSNSCAETSLLGLNFNSFYKIKIFSQGKLTIFIHFMLFRCSALHGKRNWCMANFTDDSLVRHFDENDWFLCKEELVSSRYISRHFPRKLEAFYWQKGRYVKTYGHSWRIFFLWTRRKLREFLDSARS